MKISRDRLNEQEDVHHPVPHRQGQVPVPHGFYVAGPRLVYSVLEAMLNLSILWDSFLCCADFCKELLHRYIFRLIIVMIIVFLSQVFIQDVQ